jgi:hypothetical protein
MNDEYIESLLDRYKVVIEGEDSGDDKVLTGVSP